MIFVNDLDGSTSDHHHRLHYVTPPPGVKKDYGAYYSRMGYDPPFLDAQRALFRLAVRRVPMFTITGRPEQYRRVTESWLETHYPFLERSPAFLFMRPNNDHRKAVVFKEEVVLRLKAQFPQEQFVFADDDARNNEMFVKHGLLLRAPDCWAVLR